MSAAKRPILECVHARCEGVSTGVDFMIGREGSGGSVSGVSYHSGISVYTTLYAVYVHVGMRVCMCA